MWKHDARSIGYATKIGVKLGRIQFTRGSQLGVRRKRRVINAPFSKGLKLLFEGWIIGDPNPQIGPQLNGANHGPITPLYLHTHLPHELDPCPI